MAISDDVTLDPHEPALAGYRRVLAHLALGVEANRPGVIEDAGPEHLHDLRIAVRRTRSLLAESKRIVPGAVRRLHREAFGRLGQQTGPVRDLDVFGEVWEQDVARLGLGADAGVEKVTRELATRRSAAHEELARLLAGDQTRVMLEAWRRWLVDPHVEADPAAPLGPVVVRRIERAQQQVLAGGRAITPTSPADRLHEVRKDAKRVRYLIEGFGSLLDAKGRKRFVTQLKDLQDNLGAHQDAEVQVGLVRLLARDLDSAGVLDTDTLLSMGRLGDQMRQRQEDERQAFDDRFTRYDSKENRQALAVLLAEIR